MPSRNTLVWIGALAAAFVVAAASALYWTHPGFLWWNAARAPVVASAPAESKPPPTVPPAVQAAPPAASAPNQAATSPLKPAFDVVNVDPSGEAVVAGRAAPNAKVELRDAGKTVAEATADSAGQFVIIPPALAPGDHSLSLSASAGKAEPETSKAVAVSVPTQEAKVATSPGQPEGKAAAAAAPAGATPPATLAPPMRTVATASAASGSRVVIQSVEADAVGGLFAKGLAEPNATVRLYLNDVNVADAKTQADGRWSLTIKGGMTPGGYLMRADELSPGSAAVIASVNTPFDYPDALASASLSTPTAAAPIVTSTSAPPSSPSQADPVIESVQTKRVAIGHTLWELSRNYYGDPTRYPEIYEANKWEIHNPNLIYPGEVFVVPKSAPKP